MSPFAAAIAAAASGSPMSNGGIRTIRGRILLIDGDGLAYYCAGREGTQPGEARKAMLDKVSAAQRACGAEEVRILLTARDSHKGYRYAVARVKPYQGQRTNSHRPACWQVLRDVLEADAVPGATVEATSTAEADDLFSRYAMHHPDCVIMTQDKDMRMVPGWHLDWLTHILFRLSPGTFRSEHGGKLWGRAWFWAQMLHGDNVDNIPGLPWYTDGSIVGSGPNKGQVKQIRCGEGSTAVKQLASVYSDMGALLLCQNLYRSCYDDRWLVEMLEQAILLWMRNDQTSSPFNVAHEGNPMWAVTHTEEWPAAKAEILQRIAEAVTHEKAQGSGDSGGPLDAAAEEQHAMRALLAPVQPGRSSAGPQPFDGNNPGHSAPGMQLAAGEGREQRTQVRSQSALGVPAWLRTVLARP